MLDNSCLVPTSLSLAQRAAIERRCGAFEDALARGTGPRITDYLTGEPDETRSYLFSELLLIELEQRQQDQTGPQIDAYVEMYPAFGDAIRFAFARLGNSHQPQEDNGGGDVETSRLGSTGDARLARTSLRPPQASPVGTDKSAAARFTIRRLHAQGGLGTVWVAHDRALNRQVALKQIQENYEGDENMRWRFLREAAITGRLEHPNIVPVYALGQQDDAPPFYVMPLIGGDHFGKLIDGFHQASSDQPNTSQLELRNLLSRFIDVCHAIDYAHHQGVVHRDIKPKNIMVGQYGETLVIDWGLAKIVNDNGTKLSEPVSPDIDSPELEATRWGDRVGTLRYMSPEQAAGRNDEVGPASDIYNLGATLYHLLTGYPPFSDEEDTPVLIRRIQRGDVKRIRPGNRRIPRALDAICQQAMATSVEQRYASAEQIAKDIERWLADEPVSARRESLLESTSRWVRRHRSWTLAGGTALLLVTLVSLTAVFLVNRAREHQTRLARDKADLAEDKSQLAEEKSQLATEKTKLADELGVALVDSQRKSGELKGQLRTIQIQHWISSSRGIRDETPLRSLLLAAEALQAAQQEELAVLPEAHGNLRDALDSIGGIGLPASIGRGDLAISPNSRWLVASDHLDVQLWDLTADDPTQANVLLNAGFACTDFAFSADNRWLITSRAKWAMLWDLTAKDISGSSKSLTSDSGSEWRFDPNSSRIIAMSKMRTQIWSVSLDDVIELENIQGRVVAMSPDTRWMMTSSEGHEQLWDSAPQRGEQAAILLPHPNYHNPVTVGPNHRWLAATSATSVTRLPVDVVPFPGAGNRLAPTAFASAKTKECWIVKHASDPTENVRLWDLRARPASIVKEFVAHQGRVKSIKITPNGRWLISLGQDKTIRLWDLKTGEPTSETIELATFHHYVERFDISSDSHWLIAQVMDEPALRLWDLTAKNPATTSIILRAHDASVWTWAISPDCRWLTSADRDGKSVRLWDLTATLTPTSSEVLPRGHFRTFALSTDSRRLGATIDFEGLSNSGESVQLYHLGPEHARNSELVQCLRNAYRGATSPDHRWAATHEPNGLRLWHLEDDSASFRVDFPGSPSHLSFSADGRRLFVSSMEGDVYLCDLTSANSSDQIVLLGQHPDLRRFVASSDGRWLVTTSLRSGPTKLWDLTAQPASPVVISEERNGTAISPEISPDSRWLVYVDPALCLLDLTSPDPVSTLKRIPGEHQRPVISPDSRRLAAVFKGHVICYELPLDFTSETNVILTAPEVEPAWTRFSPDSRLLVSGAYDHAAHLWDLETGNPAASKTVFVGHNGIVHTASVSPSGRWLITGGDDKTVRLWDLTAPKPADTSVVFRGHQGWVTSAAMSEDDRWLISAGGDVRLWDLRIDNLIDQARRVAGRELTDEERRLYSMEVLEP